MNQKGFANTTLIVSVVVSVVFLVVFLVVVVRYFALNNRSVMFPPTPPAHEQPMPSPSPTPRALKTGDIEEIQTLLNKQAWVRVIVMLRGNEFTVPEFQDDIKQEAEIKKIQDAVIVTLTENDFQVSHQYQFIVSFAGAVSESGMEKLLNNSEVISISMDRSSAPS